MRILPREYQQKIADKIIKSRKNTLIVLPTGLGKTLVGALVIDHFLKNGKKAMFLAPTRPLVDQHAKRLQEYLAVDPTRITGGIPPAKRKELYTNELIISTPQCISNDLKRFDVLADFGLVIFDEAHRSVGKYAYTHVAQIAKENGILIVGLTASPGGKAEKINEIMRSLFIDHVEIRTEKEKDVTKYVQPLKIEWKYVDLPAEIREACKLLEQVLDEKAQVLAQFGIVVSKKIARGRLSQIYRALAEHKNLAALGHFSVFYNAFHSIELLETEGPYTFSKFFERLRERKRRIDARIVRVYNMVKGKEHPKIERLLELCSERKDKKIIIFAQYRDQVNHIVDVLSEHGFAARRFLGKKGGSQKEQKETIEDFAADKFNMLVCSAIGEEGIDIPSTDVAVFYEPIPSEIRTIQRRGRVARLKGGEVIVLVTKGTRDEIFKWVSAARERKMHKIIKEMKTGKRKIKGRKKRTTKTETEEQPKITDFLG